MLSLFLIAVLFVPLSFTTQQCNPAVVDYIVRDEKGQVMSQDDLKAIHSLLPKTIGDANVNPVQVSFASDKTTYYWPEDVKWKQGTKVNALAFANARTCTLHLPDVTLEYQGRKMRLIFNIEISRQQNDRRQVVDSVPFQEGTFQLDMTGWTHDEDKLIPATRWKKVKE